MFAPSPARGRRLLAALGLCGTAALALLAAVCVPRAHADGLPLPTLPVSVPVSTPALPPPPTVPSVPVTVPTLPLPETTPTTTTGDPAPAQGGSEATASDAPSSVNTPSATTAPGTVRLADGTISVSAASAIRPLRVVGLRVQPAAVRRHGQQLLATLRVVDRRGYLVRGLVIRVLSSPAGRIGSAAARTALNGSVRLVSRTTARLPLRRGTRLRLVFTGSAVRKLVSVPVKPGA